MSWYCTILKQPFSILFIIISSCMITGEILWDYERFIAQSFSSLHVNGYVDFSRPGKGGILININLIYYQYLRETLGFNPQRCHEKTHVSCFSQTHGYLLFLLLHKKCQKCGTACSNLLQHIKNVSTVFYHLSCICQTAPISFY